MVNCWDFIEFTTTLSYNLLFTGGSLKTYVQFQIKPSHSDISPKTSTIADLCFTPKEEPILRLWKPILWNPSSVPFSRSLLLASPLSMSSDRSIPLSSVWDLRCCCKCSKWTMTNLKCGNRVWLHRTRESITLTYMTLSQWLAVCSFWLTSFPRAPRFPFDNCRGRVGKVVVHRTSPHHLLPNLVHSDLSKNAHLLKRHNFS